MSLHTPFARTLAAPLALSLLALLCACVAPEADPGAVSWPLSAGGGLPAPTSGAAQAPFDDTTITPMETVGAGSLG